MLMTEHVSPPTASPKRHRSFSAPRRAGAQIRTAPLGLGCVGKDDVIVIPLWELPEHPTVTH